MPSMYRSFRKRTGRSSPVFYVPTTPDALFVAAAATPDAPFVPATPNVSHVLRASADRGGLELGPHHNTAAATGIAEKRRSAKRKRTKEVESSDTEIDVARTVPGPERTAKMASQRLAAKGTVVESFSSEIGLERSAARRARTKKELSKRRLAKAANCTNLEAHARENKIELAKMNKYDGNNKAVLLKTLENMQMWITLLMTQNKTLLEQNERVIAALIIATHSSENK